jgi:hypothetical protein
MSLFHSHNWVEESRVYTPRHATVKIQHSSFYLLVITLIGS